MRIALIIAACVTSSLAAITLLVFLLAQPSETEPNSDIPQWAQAVLDSKPKECDWQREYNSTIAALGASQTSFMVSSDTSGYYGRVRFDEKLARISPDTPCRFVADTIRHEWLHVQQARKYGGTDGVLGHYGNSDNYERVADCGARLLGSKTTPYVDPDFAETDMFIGECTKADIREARQLIAYEVAE